MKRSRLENVGFPLQEKLIFRTEIARSTAEKTSALARVLHYLEYVEGWNKSSLDRVENEELPHAIADYGKGRFEIWNARRGDNKLTVTWTIGTRSTKDLRRILKAPGEKNMSREDQSLLANLPAKKSSRS